MMIVVRWRSRLCMQISDSVICVNVNCDFRLELYDNLILQKENHLRCMVTAWYVCMKIMVTTEILNITFNNHLGNPCFYNFVVFIIALLLQRIEY
jgi:hypothetical protein